MKGFTTTEESLNESEEPLNESAKPQIQGEESIADFYDSENYSSQPNSHRGMLDANRLLVAPVKDAPSQSQLHTIDVHDQHRGQARSPLVCENSATEPDHGYGNQGIRRRNNGDFFMGASTHNEAITTIEYG